jgi:hypothetical protein
LVSTTTVQLRGDQEPVIKTTYETVAEREERLAAEDARLSGDGVSTESLYWSGNDGSGRCAAGQSAICDQPPYQAGANWCYGNLACFTGLGAVALSTVGSNWPGHVVSAMGGGYTVELDTRVHGRPIAWWTSSDGYKGYYQNNGNPGANTFYNACQGNRATANRSCTQNSDCCSQVCDPYSGSCQCSYSGGTCIQNADCCNNNCINGACAIY